MCVVQRALDVVFVCVNVERGSLQNKKEDLRDFFFFYFILRIEILTYDHLSWTFLFFHYERSRKQNDPNALL